LSCPLSILPNERRYRESLKKPRNPRTSNYRNRRKIQLRWNRVLLSKRRPLNRLKLLNKCKPLSRRRYRPIRLGLLLLPLPHP
jgi:hypothetical protein